MAPTKKNPTPAEVGLVQLKSCLVNLPSALVTVLVNANTAAQNVIVELQFKAAIPSDPSAKDNNGSGSQQSVYVGWTGMPSKRKLASVVGRGSQRGGPAGREQDLAVVEVDATFGRMLGLTDGQKVGVLLHLDPPLAHTVNIEPLTPGDWEIIELHATFLELNLLSQVRALPNPSFAGSPSSQARQSHPLTLHLSPTSTANVIVSSLAPALPSTSPFAKISPDAEVIVAPKTRPRLSRNSRTESRSITSASRKSGGGRSGTGGTRQPAVRRSVLLRAIDRGIGGEWFDDEDEEMPDSGFRVWVDRDILSGKWLRGTEWATVSVIRPPGLQPPVDPQQQQQNREREASEAGKAATKIVAKLSAWENAPDSLHATLSSSLCSALDVEGIVGGIIRVEPAPVQLPRNTIKSLKIFPFLPSGPRNEGLKFGGETKSSRETAAARIRAMYGGGEHGPTNFLGGPLTDGMVLTQPTSMDLNNIWEGGLLRFEIATPVTGDKEKSTPTWALGLEHNISIEVQQEIPHLKIAAKSSSIEAEPLPVDVPSMVSIDKLIAQLTSHLRHCSSVLLTGGLGSGKTSLAYLLAHRMRREELYHTTYFPCRKLVTDETRISTIKETLNRVMMNASWGARFGGHALVILDDLDRLCPVETELQVGGENGRSRQISELICSIVRQYCGAESGVVLLATAQGKEALNNVIVGGHVVREIVSLKAPDKEARRRVLESLVAPVAPVHHLRPKMDGVNGHATGSSDGDVAAWMDGPADSPRQSSSAGPEGFVVQPDLDFLDLAGHTDGYMPGDLVLLVSRARSEALIRTVEATSDSTDNVDIHLGKEDFERALKGFTPASLRNVTLQSSTTTFDSIGGLHATRKTLLETLQYPTTYAPIFAQCPLRLRSGLLLYGFPGCGKTLLASAVAGECGLNFISVKGPEILNKYIGASEKSVRDLFERAEAARPCVLFFDEFDSIAPKRGHDSTGVTDRVVNQLLTQMDGAEGLSGVYVLAATSRPDLIDPALLRPGRLDKSLICDLPNLDDRLDILRALSKQLKLAPSILSSSPTHQSLHEVARRTDGYSGADLQAVIYNAHLEAIHDILGDHDTAGQMNTDKKYKDKDKTSSKVSRASGAKADFIQFRFGEEDDRKESAERAAMGVNRSKQLMERAAIVAKLDAMKQARRKERALRRANDEHHRHDRGSGVEDQGTRQHGSSGGVVGGKGEKEVVIAWKHLERSLASTRSSISGAERRRLEAIYREFVVGRNGEMPSGQGPTEVGGRSSLM
ncbi:peroxisome biosynthesis protein (pas1 peroxin-1) [Lasallia pustulata]|uniref:Peroxisomal ATPase PEX1 n=1 Tax=Lasallia pustulata TaxID=136370 RepID=A0A1W5DA66_9LECA|nr:peroxisome biosynthesis protein (pas1 peroxin-1) [Lasallia pustulata]